MLDLAHARGILAELVAFPTVSSASNLELVARVEGLLAEHGITARRVPSADGLKASLHAAVGPEVPGGVVLSGHSDVVPVEGQAWTVPPFALTRRDGRLMGRGVADMKGFVALAIAALLAAHGQPLRRPLMLALSHDEEIGCLAAPALVRDLLERRPRPALAIIGEPSMMQVVTAHKGSLGLSVHVRGHPVHSALLPQGVSAVMEGARLICWANAENTRLAAAAPSPVAALFDPPHSTIHVGMIEGGTAHNITAADCRFSIDLRCVPDESPDEWEALIRAKAEAISGPMRARHPQTGIDVSRSFLVPPLRPEPDNPAERLARRLTGDNATHVVSYGTEAGQFQEAGIPAVICGPGDIAQAHQPDEWLADAQFAAGAAFLDKLIQHLTE